MNWTWADRGNGMLFLWMMLAMGAFLFGVSFVRKAWIWNDARSWTPVAATVTASGVEVRHGRKGRTRTVARVRYLYTAAEREYAGDSDDGGFGAPGTGPAAEQVAALPVGRVTTCYVDPQDPARSALDREWHDGITLSLGTLGLPVAAAGSLLALWLRRERTPPAAGSLLWVAERRQRLGRAAFLDGLFLAALCPAVPLAVVYFARVNPVIVAMVTVPCVTVLALLGGLAAHATLAVWNPRVWLSLTPAVLEGGRRAEGEYAVLGDAARVDRLTVSLVARGVHEQGEGKRRRVDVTTLLEVDVLDLPGPVPPRGRFRFTPPAGPVESARRGLGTGGWWLVVRAEIPNWPDVCDETPVRVARSPAILDPGGRAGRRYKARPRTA